MIKEAASQMKLNSLSLDDLVKKGKIAEVIAKFTQQNEPVNQTQDFTAAPPQYHEVQNTYVVSADELCRWHDMPWSDVREQVYEFIQQMTASLKPTVTNEKNIHEYLFFEGQRNMCNSTTGRIDRNSVA